MTSSLVGTKGQVVIQKGIRDQLGVKPGWRAIQRAVGDHVELYFLPPRHNHSLRGVLASHIKAHVAAEDWDAARESAWAAMARESSNDTVN